MSMFTLAISCLTTSNLPWFMDLTFQFLCNIVLYNIGLYFHHQSHPQLGVVFALAPSLHSFWSLHWCLVAYWAPTDLGSSSFSVLSFCLFILFMGFARQDTEVVCHSLFQWTTFKSELSTMTHLSLVALHGMAHGFIELNKAGVHVIIADKVL